MGNYQPSISVVIPVKNGYPEIKDCIEGILKQTIQVKEILVIDSGSTDGTIEYLKTVHSVRLIEIDPASFNHGSTRNIGWEKSEADFLLYTVQDARAADEYWIEELLKGFIDESVAAVCGQQIVPWDKDKNPVDWFRPVSEPQLIRYQFKTTKDFEQLKPAEQRAACSWDDVTAMYRMRVLQEVNFSSTVFGEDMVWAKHALQRGYALVYNYKARVYHYHIEDENFSFKRNFTTMYFRYKEFGYLPPKPTLDFLAKLRILKCLIKSLQFDLVGIVKWYSYNLRNFHATAKSHQLFMKTLHVSEKTLDEKHSEICSAPPSPLKVK